MAGNPLRSEDAAFRWVLGTLLAAAVIVAASWVAAWLGVAAAVLLVATAVWRLVRARRRRPVPPPAGRASVEDTPED